MGFPDRRIKIITLIENTQGHPECRAEHGLSFYIEMGERRILMDTGASDAFLTNAGKLGVDLGTVDTVVLSHGHYDHTGGAEAFLERNGKAPIYLHRNALAESYGLDEDGKMRGGPPRPGLWKRERLSFVARHSAARSVRRASPIAQLVRALH